MARPVFCCTRLLTAKGVFVETKALKSPTKRSFTESHYQHKPTGGSTMSSLPKLLRNPGEHDGDGIQGGARL